MRTRTAERELARPLVAAPASPLGRLGSWSYRHRRLVAVAWVVALVVISLAGRLAGSQFKDNLNGGTATPSQQAAAFLQRSFPSQAGDVAQVVFQTRAPVTSAAARDRITAALAGVARLPHVASVLSPFAPGAAGQVSRDGHIAYGLVRFDASGDALPDPAIQRVIDRAQRAAGPGFTVQLGGAPVEKTEKPQFGTSEALGILAAVVILLLAFGSVIAMVLPIVTAVVAVGASFGVLDLLSHQVTVPSFAPELAALVGLGVGIDYALFVVTRYRSALREGSAPPDAVVAAMATSGRAAFRAGRLAVHDPAGLPAPRRAGELRREADPAGLAVARRLAARCGLDGPAAERAVRHAAELAAYQDTRLAARYLDLVAAAARAEARQAGPAGAGGALTEGVAAGFFHLLAYKDEYEVARLHLLPEFDQALADAVGGGRDVRYLLHPPVLRALGLRQKIAFPAPVIRPAFRVLRGMRHLRGTPADPFGYTRVRRTERRLAAGYEAEVRAALAVLSPASHAAAVELARLPLSIRGYEQIKMDAVERYEAELERLRPRLS